MMFPWTCLSSNVILFFPSKKQCFYTSDLSSQTAFFSTLMPWWPFEKVRESGRPVFKTLVHYLLLSWLLSKLPDISESNFSSAKWRGKNLLQSCFRELWRQSVYILQLHSFEKLSLSLYPASSVLLEFKWWCPLLWVPVLFSFCSLHTLMV